jgi:hypothetical protein
MLKPIKTKMARASGGTFAIRRVAQQKSARNNQSHRLD